MSEENFDQYGSNLSASGDDENQLRGNDDVASSDLPVGTVSEQEYIEDELTLDSAKKILNQYFFQISGYPQNEIVLDHKTKEKKSTERYYHTLHNMPQFYQKALGFMQLNIPRTNLSISIRNDKDEKVNLEIAPGITAIFGASNSGKTAVLRHIANELKKDVVVFHEPELPVLLSVKSLVDEIHSFLNGDEEVMLVDSFRFFIYNSNAKAAAMSGGISASFFTELTNLSIIAASLNKKLVVNVNFLSESDKVTDVVWNALVGSVAGVGMTSIVGSRVIFDYQARTLSSMRQKKMYQLPALSNTESMQTKKDKIPTFSLYTVGNDGFSASFKRIINNLK